MKCILKAIFSVFSLATLSFADIIHIPADIDSIQGGIDLANPGDTVLVQPGTYVENINFNGKNIVVGSLTLTTGDTSYNSQTVIDGNRSGSVVTFENGEDSTAFLCGFTLTNGFKFRPGGGIFMSGASPRLSHLLIINNATWGMFGYGGSGGGIHCENSNSILTDVEIKANVSGIGGGIYCGNSDIVMVNVTVSGNRGGGMPDGLAGGGIYCDNSNPTLINVIVSGNKSTTGGGISCENSSPSFSSVTISRNTAYLGGGISFSGSSNPSFDPVNRCNIYFNESLVGRDLLTADSLNIMIVVDTFTVLNPDSSHAYPLNNFTFDIQNAVVTNIPENPVSPTKFALHQNYPNPFNPSTTIEFTLPKSNFVTLKVYNILGKEVATLVSNKLNQGNHTYQFDGSKLASGIYYYSIVASEYRQVKKMMLIK